MSQFVPAERLIFTKFPEATFEKITKDASPVLHSQSLEQLKLTGVIDWERTCLLDMEASEELTPEDAGKFDVVVAGGILGNVHENEDGSYASDDRTAEVRQVGFAHRRHLGPLQMTTDTALLTSFRVLDQGLTLQEIPFVDEPEIDCGEGACTEMKGFRYVGRRGADGEWEPVLPEGMRELMAKSMDDDILDNL
eukprot:CAMPEP_0204328166 /NCGR_PEP_ID=MMETSP0469-20131031/13167_1 /ASSEMBLY_ACC=CAM_ASM_000384 /TAXON_ID=2969 /ORGANISM="Oxyrrhis marina" /LENGTH=193 /DNA_ID=CAMNT_0051310519 /DNA_START=1 /DNA_END=582 /DNA_ORIENTATION=-